MRHLAIPSILILVSILLLAACVPATTPQPTAAPVEPTGAPTNTPPAATATATATTPPEPRDLVFTGRQQFFPDGEKVYVIFEVENPNTQFVLVDGMFDFTVYDSAGLILDEKTDYLPVILPGEKRFIVGWFNSSDQQADHLTVNFSGVTPTPYTSTETGFSIEEVTLTDTGTGFLASCTVYNNLDWDFPKGSLTVIGYNADGAIIGAGSGVVDPIPANGKDQAYAFYVGEPPDRVEAILDVHNFNELAREETAKETEEPGGLALQQSAFFQDGVWLHVPFVFVNQSSYALEGSTAHLLAYDANGSLLAEWTHTIDYILPYETSAPVAERPLIPADATVERVEIELTAGKVVTSSLSELPFTVGTLNYLQGLSGDSITAIVNNDTDYTLVRLSVTALGMDEAGEIVSYGITELPFITSNDSSGVQVWLSGQEAPAQVKLYPSLTSSYSIKTDTGNPVKVIRQGYGRISDFYHVGFQFMHGSTGRPMLLDYVNYTATAYDAAGNVLAWDSGYTTNVFPNRETAGYSYLDLSGAQAELDRIEVKAYGAYSSYAQGFYDESLVENGYPLSAEEVGFSSSDETHAKASGTIRNHWDMHFIEVEVIALAFDENDAIIGAGIEVFDDMPGGYQTPVTVNMIVSGDPQRVELHPNFLR